MDGLEEIQLMVNSHYDTDITIDTMNLQVLKARKVFAILAFHLLGGYYKNHEVAKYMGVTASAASKYRTKFRRNEFEYEVVQEADELLTECEYIKNYYLYKNKAS